MSLPVADQAASEASAERAVLPRAERIAELDWLKGFAILSVIWIHAKPFDTSIFYVELIDRAVLIFLVLFGVSSELWWNRAAVLGTTERLAHWYGQRLWRLMLPVWTAVTLWWIAAVLTGVAESQHLGWTQVLATYAGYAPWIGVSWFVTIILQLVLLFPLLHWLAHRLGLLSLIAAAAISALCIWRMWDIIDLGKSWLASRLPEPGWYYYWIFAPRALWHVVGGIFIARTCARPGPWATAIATALALLSMYLEDIVRQPIEPLMLGPQAAQFLDQRLAAGIVLRPTQALPVSQVAQQHL